MEILSSVKPLYDQFYSKLENFRFNSLNIIITIKHSIFCLFLPIIFAYKFRINGTCKELRVVDPLNRDKSV